jgi:hypothetical protein
MRTEEQTEEEIEGAYIVADELERQWKLSLPKHTDKDLVEAFSPPIETIQAKIEDWQEEQRKRALKIKQALTEVYRTETDEFTQWFNEQMIKLLLLPKLKECNQHITRLKRILNILTPGSLKDSKQEEIEKARQYPIYEIARSRLLLRECGNKYSALCPFHEEKHASFYIYPETNTFHCFGCQENGDIIKLTMHLYGASFGEAIQMLQQ